VCADDMIDSKSGWVINKFGLDVARSIADQTLGIVVLFNLILFLSDGR
jgi:hypothetical protein